MDVLQSKKKHLQELLRVKYSAGPNPRVLILGLGLQGGGVGAARFFARLGWHTTVTDMRDEKALAPSLKALKGLPIEYVLGTHRVSDVEKANLIVKNPGVPARAPILLHAKKKGIPITNDADLFLTLAPPARTIGVTGTKGKTTTTLLIAHLLGPRAMAVGTPGVSFFEYFFAPKEPEWVVGEFSSFDLEYVTSNPHVSVYTSLFSDHLNRYPSFAAYAKAKSNLFRFQSSKDIAILAKTPIVQKYLPTLRSRKVWVKNSDLPSDMKNVSWRIARPAIALATRVARELGVPETSITKRLRTFEAPHGRLEIVKKTKKSLYINDTTATNPGAACYSLSRLYEEFGKEMPITIIAGGDDKSLPEKEIKEYAALMKKYHVRILLLPGSMTDKLQKFLPDHALVIQNFQEAVAEFRIHKSDGVLALIPGAASFNLFLNEFDRARQFIEAVKHTS